MSDIFLLGGTISSSENFSTFGLSGEYLGDPLQFFSGFCKYRLAVVILIST